MLKYIKYLFVCGIACFISCDDYVDIRTEGELIPEMTENYRYLLNNTSTFNVAYPLTDVASDDIEFRDDHATYYQENNSAYYRPFLQTYKWADSIYFIEEPDYDLNSLYSVIYNTNVIISEVGNSKGGNEAEKLALEGEAKVHRAFALLNLVNVFGPAYEEATASEDLGVPIFTEPVTSGEITRASVQEAYDLIINDLNDAINSGLPETNTGRDVAYPSLASAHALLARTYLYMGNFEEALTQAEQTLGLQNQLMNLAEYQEVSDANFPQKQDDPELILSKQATSTYRYNPTLLSLSDGLLSSFDTLDLRYQLFTRPNEDLTYGTLTMGRSYCKEALTGEARNAGPTVPEMMLIKAECLARSGNVDEALAIINELRKFRFTEDDYTELSATSNDEAMQVVLAERRRELMGKGGFRWFDLKRLNTEPEFAKTITHPFLNQTFVLEPGDTRYQFPFAIDLFNYAPDLEQNQ